MGGLKLEYKYGLGRDRRELSFYQSAEWCNQIAQLPRKVANSKGEKHWRAKLKDADVLHIRSFVKMPRALAAELADQFGIAVAYVYQLRKKINGHYKKWPHLKAA